MPEMQAPPRAVPTDDNGYFEVVTKAVFQTGLSWAVVDKKWPGFRAAFDDFDIDTVAAYTPDDEERLLADAGIVRNGRKITATIANARVMQELRDRHGSIAAWLGESADLPWPERKAAVAEPFSHVGPVGAYFFLWSVGEATPPHDQEPSWSEPAPPEAALRV